MTEAEFQKMFSESLELQAKYVATQKTRAQMTYAEHGIHHTQMNEGYFRHHALKDEPTIYLCTKCGQMETASYCEPTKSQMLETKVCFGCNHWAQLAATPNGKRLIIDGQLYSDGGNEPKAEKAYLGHAGREFAIERDGVTWTTNNLWHGGTIPYEYREQMPDNARFVKGES